MTRLENKTHFLNKRQSLQPNNILCQRLHLSELGAIYPYDYLKIIFIVLCSVSSSGNFNSEFDTYLLTSVKYGVQRPLLYKDFYTAMFLLPAAVHKLAQFGFVSIRNRKPVGIACNLCFLEEAGLPPSEPSRAGGVDRRGIFLIMLQPFCINALLPFPLPPPTASPHQRHSCHLLPHTDACSLLSQPPRRLPHPHSSSRLLLPEPSVSRAVYLPISSMGQVCFQGGQHPLEIEWESQMHDEIPARNPGARDSPCGVATNPPPLPGMRPQHPSTRAQPHFKP